MSINLSAHVFAKLLNGKIKLKVVKMCLNRGGKCNDDLVLMQTNKSKPHTPLLPLPATVKAHSALEQLCDLG